MHVVIPSSIKRLLELAKTPQSDERYVVSLIDAFIGGLAVFGVSKNMLLMLRRQFEIVGAVTPDLIQSTNSFEAILKRHDLLLGELGGFVNLFRSMSDDAETLSDPTLDFESLDAAMKAQLHPLGVAIRDINAAEDISVAVESSLVRVASCLCLTAASAWVSMDTLVRTFAGAPKFEGVERLLRFRDRLESLCAQFVTSDLTRSDLNDFALWFLAHHLSRQTIFDPLSRRLVNTMLRRVQLPELAVFERAFAQ